ncbi:MAG: hypothetical protein HYU36_06610 [Planctomycetes bacterium]|nr:hypothetical protein [Planctomycetota bacterium]
MANSDPSRRRKEDATWDEHQWEQFMKDQDRRTEMSLRLMEKYAAVKDAGTAKSHGIGALEDVRGEPGGALPQTNGARKSGAGDTELDWPDWNREGTLDLTGLVARSLGDRGSWALVRRHPAYRKAHHFCREIHRHLPEERDGESTPQPVIDLLGHAYGMTAKLAGGLGGSNMGEDLGMSIAYCKRCLGEVQSCLEALRRIEENGILGRAQLALLRQMALDVREELVSQIGLFRKLWRARYGV